MRLSACGLFLFVFFAKIVIALAPLIVDRFDRESINAVIMQLEIEKEAKEDNLEKEKFGKELWDASSLGYLVACPVNCLNKFPLINGDENHRQSFYPVILTPPPDKS